MVPACSKIWMPHLLTCHLNSERKRDSTVRLSVCDKHMSAVAVPKDIRQKFTATASPVMYVQYDRI
jgi:hypothetical protein